MLTNRGMDRALQVTLKKPLMFNINVLMGVHDLVHEVQFNVVTNPNHVVCKYPLWNLRIQVKPRETKLQASN